MRQVLDASGHPSICGQCNEMFRYTGTRRKQVISCGCDVVAKPKPRLNTARKGRRLELSERKKLEKLGVMRVRAQPGSGAFGTRVSETSLTGDNAFTIAGMALRQECKSRGNDSGFKVIKDWLQGCQVLTIKQDREPPFHVLTNEAWLHLVSAANRGGE